MYKWYKYIFLIIGFLIIKKKEEFNKFYLVFCLIFFGDNKLLYIYLFEFSYFFIIILEMGLDI